MMLAFIAMAAAGGAPRFPSLSSEEWADLRAGKVVMRAESEGARVTATGIVFVAVPPAVLWPAVLDVAARIPENRTLAAVHEYRRDSAEQWYLQVDMAVLGADLRIHHHYSWDPAANVVTYTLDPMRVNDLVRADGWYLVEPTDGGSVLVYEAVTEAKMPVPGWVKKWLARDQMEGLLQGIRKRAEQGRARWDSKARG